MSAEVKKAIQLEIGHVLFIDIVSYSKLLITEQSEQLQTLKEIVRATEQFRVAEAAGKLLRCPTSLRLAYAAFHRTAQFCSKNWHAVEGIVNSAVCLSRAHARNGCVQQRRAEWFERLVIAA